MPRDYSEMSDEELERLYETDPEFREVIDGIKEGLEHIMVNLESCIKTIKESISEGEENIRQIEEEKSRLYSTGLLAGYTLKHDH